MGGKIFAPTGAEFVKSAGGFRSSTPILAKRVLEGSIIWLVLCTKEICACEVGDTARARKFSLQSLIVGPAFVAVAVTSNSNIISNLLFLIKIIFPSAYSGTLTVILIEECIPPPLRSMLIVYYFIKFRTKCPAKNGKNKRFFKTICIF